VLPTDVVALEPGGAFAHTYGEDVPRADWKVLGCDIPDGWQGLDIGPETAEAFSEVIASAGTLLWNGPVGAFEDARFAAGTRRVARAVAECPGFTVVGGGDSASALEHLGMVDRIDFLSTGEGRRSSTSSTATCPPSTRCARHQTPRAAAARTPEDGRRRQPPPPRERQLEDAPRPHRSAAHRA